MATRRAGFMAGFAAARGEIDIAIPTLELVREKLAPGNGQTVIAIETLPVKP